MAKRIKKGLENTLPIRIICIITAAVLTSGVVTIGAMNLFCTDYLYIDYSTGFTVPSVIQGLIVLTVSAGIFAIIYNLLRNKTAVTVLLITAALLRLISALFWKIEPESDFLITYDLAKLLSDNSPWQWGAALDSYGTIYNDLWSAHMPFIIYQSLLLRITENAVILRVANAAFSWGACVLTAKTAMKLGGNKAYRMALCAMAINPAVIFFIPVLTNQHIAQFFFVLAVWIFLCSPVKNAYIRACLSGACIGISHLMRPEMQVVIIAVTAFVMYSVFRHGNPAQKLTIYAAGMCMLLSVIVAMNTFLTSAHVVHRDIYSGNLNYKIMVGLNPVTNGSWSESDSMLIGDDEAINSRIADRLKNPLRLIPMMYGKASYQLGTYVYTWAYRSDAVWLSQNVMRRGAAALMLFVCIMAAWKLLFKRRHELIWLYVTLMGYAITYSVIEVQGRYSFLFIPMLVIAAFV